MLYHSGLEMRDYLRDKEKNREAICMGKYSVCPVSIPIMREIVPDALNLSFNPQSNFINWVLWPGCPVEDIQALST